MKKAQVAAQWFQKLYTNVNHLRFHGNRHVTAAIVVTADHPASPAVINSLPSDWPQSINMVIGERLLNSGGTGAECGQPFKLKPI